MFLKIYLKTVKKSNGDGRMEDGVVVIRGIGTPSGNLLGAFIKEKGDERSFLNTLKEDVFRTLGVHA